MVVVVHPQIGYSMHVLEHVFKFGVFHLPKTKLFQNKAPCIVLTFERFKAKLKIINPGRKKWFVHSYISVIIEGEGNRVTNQFYCALFCLIQMSRVVFGESHLLFYPIFPKLLNNLRRCSIGRVLKLGNIL
jgi:hypothetical protein